VWPKGPPGRIKGVSFQGRNFNAAAGPDAPPRPWQTLRARRFTGVDHGGIPVSLTEALQQARE